MAQRPPGRVAPGDSEGITPPVSETFSAGRPGTGSPSPGSRVTGAPVRVPVPVAGGAGVGGGTVPVAGGGGTVPVAGGGGTVPVRGTPPPGIGPPLAPEV